MFQSLVIHLFDTILLSLPAFNSINIGFSLDGPPTTKLHCVFNHDSLCYLVHCFVTHSMINRAALDWEGVFAGRQVYLMGRGIREAGYGQGFSKAG